jgi:hypothetical protein
LLNLFKFIQTCSTEFIVHSAGLSANLADLSAKSAGWEFHCSNFELNEFRPVFTKFYRIRPIFPKTGGIGGSRFFSLRRFFKHCCRVLGGFCVELVICGSPWQLIWAVYWYPNVGKKLKGVMLFFQILVKRCHRTGAPTQEGAPWISSGQMDSVGF